MNWLDPPDYLEEFSDRLDYRILHAESIRLNRFLLDQVNHEMVRAILGVSTWQADYSNYENGTVEIGAKDELSEEQHQKLINYLGCFTPWRKGPFNLFGHQVDAEWRSDLKWERLKPWLPDLQGQVVCDLGCGNGYFIYRILAHNPRLVIGFDPTRKYKLTFSFLNTITREGAARFELFGFSHLQFIDGLFDTIFCMGILYHHSDPVGILKLCFQALKPGGTLVLETMGISSKISEAILPEKRYANMKNIWFVPSAKMIELWLQRSGFKEVKLIYNERLTTEEQRPAEWARVESLEHFLDPNDPGRTIEGYEAPSRIYLVARKPE